MSGTLRVLATTLAVAALVARTPPVSNLLGVVVAAASPYTPFVALTDLILSAISRRTFLTIILVDQLDHLD